LKRSTLNRIGFGALLPVFACADSMAPRAVPAEQPSGIVEQPTLGTIDLLYRRVAAAVPAFAGFYIGRDTDVVVLLTDTSAIAIAKAAILSTFGPAFGDRYSQHRWHSATARYTYLQLADWRDVLTMRLLRRDDVASVGLDQRTNVVRIRVVNDAAAAVANADLAALQLPPDAIDVRVGTAFVEAATLQDRARPLPGGYYVRADFQNGQTAECSLGVNAANNGNVTNWFLTASHCTRTQGGAPDGTVFYNTAIVSADRLGVESGDAPIYTGGACPSGRVCQRADVAIIRYDATSIADWRYLARTLSPGNGSSGSIVINSQAPRLEILNVEGYNGTPPAAIGARVDKLAHVSGWTVGEVFDVCTNVNSGISNMTLLCQTIVDGYALPGDSGGAAFFFSDFIGGTWADLYGIANLRSTDNRSWVYSPMSSIYQELGINPYVVFFCAC